MKFYLILIIILIYSIVVELIEINKEIKNDGSEIDDLANSDSSHGHLRFHRCWCIPISSFPNCGSGKCRNCLCGVCGGCI
uniref:Uncharacterized protein n=1 Tax=Meloidogyne hapla TaxID=6305 RepID=A0A1I8BTV9_MELHA